MMEKIFARLILFGNKLHAIIIYSIWLWEVKL